MPKVDPAYEPDRKKIFTNNFIAGLAWGMGSTIAVTIFAALITFILTKVDFVSVVGTFLAQLNQFMANYPSN